MINFFRKIRQSLLAENKFTKYLIYAVGEIILVVIGILLALSINNRVNFNKERQNEIIILKEIRSNLAVDLKEIDDDIRYMDTTDLACNFVSHYINTFDVPSREFGISVLKTRTTPHFNPNLSGYKLLVSKGVEIIQNDSLRKSISVNFESMYSYYNKYQDERLDYKIQTLDPILVKYFTWIPNESAFLGEYQISHQDYSRLKAENSFIKLISGIKRENNLVQNRAERVMKNIVNLTELLDNELTTRQ